MKPPTRHLTTLLLTLLLCPCLCSCRSIHSHRTRGRPPPGWKRGLTRLDRMPLTFGKRSADPEALEWDHYLGTDGVVGRLMPRLRLRENIDSMTRQEMPGELLNMLVEKEVEERQEIREKLEMRDHIKKLRQKLEIPDIQEIQGIQEMPEKDSIREKQEIRKRQEVQDITGKIEMPKKQATPDKQEKQEIRRTQTTQTRQERREMRDTQRKRFSLVHRPPRALAIPGWTMRGSRRANGLKWALGNKRLAVLDRMPLNYGKRGFLHCSDSRQETEDDVSGKSTDPHRMPISHSVGESTVYVPVPVGTRRTGREGVLLRGEPAEYENQDWNAKYYQRKRGHHNSRSWAISFQESSKNKSQRKGEHLKDVMKSHTTHGLKSLLSVPKHGDLGSDFGVLESALLDGMSLHDGKRDLWRDAASMGLRVSKRHPLRSRMPIQYTARVSLEDADDFATALREKRPIRNRPPQSIRNRGPADANKTSWKEKGKRLKKVTQEGLHNLLGCSPMSMMLRERHSRQSESTGGRASLLLSLSGRVPWSQSRRLGSGDTGQGDGERGHRRLTGLLLGHAVPMSDSGREVLSF